MFNELEENIIKEIDEKYQKAKNKRKYLIICCFQILLFFILFAGSLIVTVITYPNLFLKILFLCLYLICFAFLGVLYFYVRVKETKAGQKSKEFYKQNIALFWIGAIALYLGFLGFTFSVYIITNFDSSQIWKSIASIFGALQLIGIFVEFIKLDRTHTYNEIKGYMLLAIGACIIFIIAGMSLYLEKKTNAMIMIGVGAGALLLIGIYWVFGLLLSINAIKERTNVVAFSTILFIVIGISGGVFLRYIIIDTTLQEILTTIFAAVLGGAITLAGVAWTIKDGNDKRQKELARIENERKEEERKKYIPYAVLFTDRCTNPNHTITISNVDFSTKGELYSYEIKTFVVKNTDMATFCIGGIYFNNQVTLCRAFSLINKEWAVKFIFNKKVVLPAELQDFGIYAQDLLGNEYKIPLDFEIEKRVNGLTIIVKSCYRAEYLPEGCGLKKIENTNDNISP